MRKVIATALLCAASVSNAGMIVYNDFTDLSGFQLNGSAATLNPNELGVLRLTDDLSQAGTAFLKDTVSLSNQASFSAAFDFQITDNQGISDSDGQGADGITFIVQTLSNTAGSTGFGIGYHNITNSVAIEFDTWNNGRIDDRNGNHVGIDIGGNVDSVMQSNIATRMNNGEIWSAWVDYDGASNLLEVRLAEDGIRTSSALLSYEVDLAAELGSLDAYIGFGSGTGAAGGDHDILNLEFRDDFDPIVTRAASVPAPGSLALLAMGLLGFRLKRRQG